VRFLNLQVLLKAERCDQPSDCRLLKKDSAPWGQWLACTSRSPWFVSVLLTFSLFVSSARYDVPCVMDGRRQEKQEAD
jgi:hypothetical protein